jgi:N-acetyl-anhydromuramyl-L-alanine amidase AmpD
MNKYKIPASRVVRHSDVSGDHVRGKGKGKTDPGSAFDWDKFQKQLVT